MSGRASLRGGYEAGAAQLDGEKRLTACWVGKRSTKETGESRKLECVEVVVDGAKRMRVACMEVVRHLVVMQKAKF